MRPAWLIVAVLSAPAARADDGAVHTTAELWRQQGPWLDIDPVLRPAVEGLAPAEQTEHHWFELGPRTRARTEATTWSNDLDVESRGWRLGLELSHDFGWARLIAHGSLDHYDSRFEHGSYADVGLSVVKTLRLSRWMTAWIALTIGQRYWLGLPSPRQENATQVWLGVGTTFR